TLNPEIYPSIAVCELSDVITGEQFLVGFVHVQTKLLGGSLHERIKNKILSTVAKSDYYSMIIAPEYSFSRGRNPFNEKEKDKIVERIAEATKSRNALVVPGTIVWHKWDLLYNTAYAIADGEVLCEYHKQRITVEEDLLAHRNNARFYSGKAPGVFEWNGLHVGIEICADAGLLDKSMKYCDLQILVSCGMSWTEPCAKYVLVNDGNLCTLRAEKEGKAIFCRERK
ncbi:hypothetical protein HY484_04255, partial [Candidatus Woesearchaeota archaeon]|nr:hypothetical protein [Candidatus Woesearchaeota archaeon]